MKRFLFLLLLCGCSVVPIGVENVVLGAATIPGDPEETKLEAAVIATIELDPSLLPIEESYTSLKIDSLVLDLVPNAESQISDFSFVETVGVFAISADARVLIASSFPGKQSAKLKLSCEDIDLKPFLDASGSVIEIELTGHAPAQEVSFEISADLSVTLGARIQQVYAGF